MKNNKQKIPKKLYKKILENIIIVDVDAIVYNKGKVLLVYRNQEPAKNHWWVPGGRQRKFEVGEEAVVGKVNEETGLDVKVEKLVGVYEEIFKKTPFHDIKETHHLVRVYLVKLLNENQEVRLDKTSSYYKWINKIEKDLHPYVKKILKGSGVFN